MTTTVVFPINEYEFQWFHIYDLVNKVIAHQSTDQAFHVG